MSVDRTKIQWNGWGWTARKDQTILNEDVWKWLAMETGMPSLLATPARPLEEITIAPPRLGAAERTRLSQMIGERRVQDGNYERAFHARGRSYHDLLHLRSGDLSVVPDAVVYPRSTAEVLALLSFASENGIAVVPYGGGTSVVGSVTADPGSFQAVIALDMSGMDRLIEVDPISNTASSEAGIYGPSLDTALRGRGVTLGHYPQSFEFSTLGGWIAHRGAGQQSARYGRPDDWLVSAKLATPRGLLSTEEFPASSAGPRMTDLVLGSEGAFGVITEATFKTVAVPSAHDYRAFLFRDFASGATAIRRAVHNRIPFAMLRLSDAEETRFGRALQTVGKPASASDVIANTYLRARGMGSACAMITGFEGNAASVARSRERFEAIAGDLGAVSAGASHGEHWYESRFAGPYMRDPMLDRGLGVDTLETAASWSKLDNLYAAVKTALMKAMREAAPRPGAHGIVGCHISHSYADGASLYFTYIFPRALDGEIAQWQAIKRAATDAIVANGGTISHHHGVGQDHLPWMEKEKSPLGVDVLRAIKNTLDPKGILNPGKLISQ